MKGATRLWEIESRRPRLLARALDFVRNNPTIPRRTSGLRVWHGACCFPVWFESDRFFGVPLHLTGASLERGLRCAVQVRRAPDLLSRARRV